jgi:regulatory protein
MARGKQASGSPSETAGTSPSGTEVGDPEAQARQICLRLLTLAPKTRAQLAAALRRNNIPAEAAEAVLARFTDVGLIDDAAFARAWVESVETLDPEQEVATARRLAEQKMAATRGQPPEARARRAAGALARKGYPPALVFRLIKEVLEQEGTDNALDLDPDQYLDPDAEPDQPGE